MYLFIYLFISAAGLSFQIYIISETKVVGVHLLNYMLIILFTLFHIMCVGLFNIMLTYVQYNFQFSLNNITIPNIE